MSVVAAGGFLAGGVACGIKGGETLDLAVVAADRVVPAAGVFTTSTTAAPPVLVSRDHLTDGLARVVVLNSGCANAGTGAEGHADAIATARAAAALYGCAPDEVLVCSTGMIGPRLPSRLLIEGLPKRLDSEAMAGTAAAEAIMTTDSVSKEAVLETAGYTIGGMAKGAGMIRPDMATMLAVITTDARMAPTELREALAAAVDESFNSLNVDGCQSTNDSVLIMASGESGVAPDLIDFRAALTEVCRDLAHQIAADAEGARRVITVQVTGAVDDRTARQIGKALTDSDLVRSSFYGGDPNWGRIFGALGVGPGEIAPDSISVSYEGVLVASGGVGVSFDEAPLLSTLQNGDFTVDVTIGDGPGRATVLTTDLTPEYVRFNGERS
ncbi:MAG: bifunctional glutamate N-acetyltransferase/amino-acid acetyltransferase ArgJ [Acidimicrobiia bacterium]|nr:bifunctional glutamate N-acetyltransferase/amino-acid acetyltransferase ArgJ [Acidimicrobiia bacterium]